MVMEIMLEEYGFTTDSANNGAEAVKKIEELLKLSLDENSTRSMYTLILLDYSMPLMDGPMVSEIVRKRFKRHRSRVQAVVMSEPYICCYTAYNDKNFKR